MELPANPSDAFQSRLSDRLLQRRTLMCHGPATTEAVGRWSEQLLALNADSDAPVRVVMSDIPNGDTAAALSFYDHVRAMDAPVTAVCTGRIVGAGLVAFLGAPKHRRFGLPHARFGLREPAVDARESRDLEGAAAEGEWRTNRVVSLVADATGQSESAVREAMGASRTMDADAAVEWGLIAQVVDSPRADAE